MIVKMKGQITKFQAARKRDSNIEALVLLVIGVTVVLAIAIAIVVIMVEFCGGSWSRPLSQDVFSAQVKPQALPGAFTPCRSIAEQATNWTP